MSATEHSADARAADLSARWALARLAALRTIVGERAQGNEVELLAAALEVDTPGTLRRVFDNSARLGAGFRRHYRQHLTLGTLPALLAQLDIACLKGGHWRTAESAAQLERPACVAERKAGRCDYWREAIDGLVVGLSDQVRHTRHRSFGHGDDACLDVLYDGPASEARYGPLPAGAAEAVHGIQRLLSRFSQQFKLTLLGLSEGVLLYRLDGDAGTVPEPVQTLIERELTKLFPHFERRELSPRPVYGGPA